MNKKAILCVDDEAIIVMSIKQELKAHFRERLLYETALSAADGLSIIDELSEGLAMPSEAHFTPPKTVRIGEQVEIVNLKTRGTVLTLPDGKGEVQIQAGIMKLKAHLSQLRIVEAPQEKKSTVLAKTGAAARNVPMELDVRGMAQDEALPEVDRYLDEATLAGLHEVSIIHGKGTGVLRTGIHRHLKGHMDVKSFRLGVYGEGEDGVTVVTLK